jgi:hypothetical protein
MGTGVPPILLKLSAVSSAGVQTIRRTYVAEQSNSGRKKRRKAVPPSTQLERKIVASWRTRRPRERITFVNDRL